MDLLPILIDQLKFLKFRIFEKHKTNGPAHKILVLIAF